MKLILSHPTGNANVRAAANAFAQEDMLCQFYTSIFSFPGSFLDKMSKYSPLSEIKRREYDIVLKPYAVMSPYRELGRIVSLKAGMKSLTKHETGFFSIDRVFSELDEKIARKLRKNKACGVYAYEDGALNSFREAALHNLPRLYDLPIGYWRTAQRLLEKERELWPDWAETMVGLSDSGVKLAQKDEELSLADRIFVASTFTAKTLTDYPGQLAPIEIIPYGFPIAHTTRQYKLSSNNQRLKLLFVGGLSQRKGIANLFSAVEKLKNNVELTVVGHKTGNNCPALNESLKKHRWINSLPHQEILNLMREHDVLVFPSLFEGFGLVITEAMSQGTPVITTDRTAGPDLIEDGKNGWLIEAGSVEALQAAIEKLLSRPQMVTEAGREALETASKRPWSHYGSELAKAVKNSLSKQL